jgi:RNA polymerase sigma factor (TIGR02999 family)
MSVEARTNVTQILAAVSGGDRKAASDLLPVVYEELRKLARANMKRESEGHTLQPTALVHEAYMRLLGGADVKWDNRGHFFGAAARAMRRILVERARAKGRIKRGGERKRVELAEEMMAIEPESTDLLALDEALEKLEKFDQRKCEVVMLRYFAGLSIEETAAGMGLSPATVKNEWAFARAWLHRELKQAQGEDGDGPG